MSENEGCDRTSEGEINCCRIWNDEKSIENDLSTVYYCRLFSFLTEAFAGAGAMLLLLYPWCKNRISGSLHSLHGMGFVGCIMIVSLVLDCITVGFVGGSGLVQYYSDLIKYQCYTRTVESDLSSLIDNLQQILLFGIIESLLDVAEIGLDIFAATKEKYDDKKVLAWVAVVLFVIDLILSVANFFVFALPSFNLQIKDSDVCWEE